MTSAVGQMQVTMPVHSWFTSPYVTWSRVVASSMGLPLNESTPPQYALTFEMTSLMSMKDHPLRPVTPGLEPSARCWRTLVTTYSSSSPSATCTVLMRHMALCAASMAWLMSSQVSGSGLRHSSKASATFTPATTNTRGPA